MRRRRFLLVAALCGALAACSGLSGITQKPEISLAGVELVDFGLFEQRFKLDLRIQNPNDVALPIRGLSFDVELNGQHFAKGVSDQAVTVPRFGEAVLAVTATSNLGNVLRQLNELQQSGRQRADYRIGGRLELAGVGSIPFERKGDVAMPVFDAPR
jgi:LEA14-like dessication related protein